MNEYKGFKVGDKVEVIQQGLRIHYKIGEIGVVAELLTNGLLAVVFGGRREVVRPDNIKKLPKYAVGDVVRRNNKQMIKCTVTMVHPDFAYSVDDCGDLKFRETDLIPFDGFRVGDTVWTVKRGKGKIFAQNSHDDRQFGVRWEIDAPLYTFPKTTNLIPTEAKYKEALNKAGYAFKIDVAYVQEYVAKPYFGQIQVAPSPKFKVGDAVYHKGNKLFVKRNMISCPQMVEVGNSCAGYTTVVAESDLRLWKETVLTHWLDPIDLNITKMSPVTAGYGIPKCVGKIRGHDVIVFDDGNGGNDNIRVCLGHKGDDIQ